jgi:ribonuclease BN (tRNA processing enzyme)
VKVLLIPSAVSDRDRAHAQFLSSVLINDTVAVDAGCVGLFGSSRRQARVRHVLISHTHLDHIASLPVFLESVFELGDQPVTIHASRPALDCLRRDLFNDRLWPDFVTLSDAGRRFLELAVLEPGRPVRLDGLRVTPVEVNHVVPTLGFIIEERRAAVVVSSDTGPTEELWERANRTPHLKAVFLEATFPNDMAELAELAKHLTPSGFAEEVGKLTGPRKRAALIAVHLKPRFRARIIAELKALGLPNLHIARFGRPYVF